MATTDDAPRHPVAVKQFGRELNACDALLKFGQGQVDPWTGREIDGPVDGILASEGARALKTFRSALMLAGAGFGPQAAMLNRSLFEGMLVGYWATGNPEDAAHRYEKHDRAVKVRWGDIAERQRWEIDLDRLTPATDEERAEFRDLFGPYGEKSWTGLSAYNLVKSVEGRWGDEDGRATLWSFYEVAHFDNNLTLHSSAWSLSAGVRRDEDNAYHFSAGPSEDHIGRALYGSFWIYSQTLDLLIEHFEMPSKEELSKLFMQYHPRFVELNPDQVKDVGRNDPCPCGSGRKFKRCHGA